MTTIDAAAAWRVRKSITVAVCAALVSFGLAGCESGSGLFANAGDPAATQLATPQAPAATQLAKISIAPVIGAPDTVAKQLQAQLTQSIEGQRITVAKTATDPAEYTLRGYVVSAREKTRTKVSYIWDVTDQSGKRVNRITGEEVAVGPAQKDPWAAVTPQIVSNIAGKTASSIVAWLPTQTASPAVAGAQPQTSVTSPASGVPVATNAAPGTMGAAPLSPTQVVAQTPTAALPGAAAQAARPVAQGPTTGSIERPGAVSALVPSVTGAPGDGSVALTSALQRELTKSGIPLASSASPQTYIIEGKVAVGEGQNGKQPIQIDWNVKDPTGKKLGTVSQKNEIPQGSLDGTWGKTADAAASAAAQGIIKLLPGQTKTN